MLGNFEANPPVKMPDPWAPVPVRARSPALTSITRPAQRERRARILAATRMAIAQDTPEVTVRTIANMSNVSVQTIYNLVGNRAQLVEDAINEHITFTAGQANEAGSYPNIFTHIADLNWMNISQNPGYFRNIIIACNVKYFFAYKKICDRNARSLARLLKERYKKSVEQTTVDLDALARHITTLVGSSALDWARGLYGLAELRHRFAFAYGAPLMNIAPRKEWDEIYQWIENIRRTEE